jgi:glutamyl-Q tRNA(Asp) synthetase
VTGRFAPSPTGPLHLGSLLAALASCLDARARGGRWLLRIDDLDAPRCIPGMADTHQRVLEAFGFEWDEVPVFQSTRLDRYREALAELRADGLVYRCSCSRRELANGREGGAYPGTCRERGLPDSSPAATALRYRYDRRPVGAFDDLWQGRCLPESGDQGDPVVERRDSLPAYQLAVVLDDFDCSVTHVVRGADLLPSSFWQRSLQRAFGLPEPRYGHIPLLAEADGSKLAKSRHSLPLDPGHAPELLWQALALLGQRPPAELRQSPVVQIWRWALTNWKVDYVPYRTVMALPAALY